MAFWIRVVFLFFLPLPFPTFFPREFDPSLFHFSFRLVTVLEPCATFRHPFFVFLVFAAYCRVLCSDRPRKSHCFFFSTLFFAIQILFVVLKVNPFFPLFFTGLRPLLLRALTYLLMPLFTLFFLDFPSPDFPRSSR